MTDSTRRAFLKAVTAGAACSWPGIGSALKPSQIGANTAITGYGMIQSVGLLREIGFPIIEIHAMGRPEPTPGKFPGFTFNELTSTQKKSIKASLQGVPHVTSHLPYTGIEYFAKDEPTARHAVATVDTALEGSAYFGTEIAVLHPKPGAGYTLEQQWPVMLERIRRWGDMARKQGMQIALETGYPASVANFVRLVKEIDHPSVGATIDVGHQSRYAELVARVRPEDRATPAGIRAYNDTTLAIIGGLGSKVFHLHVHDIDPATWKEHLPLGTGFVDYPRLFAKLNEIGYSKYLVFEIGGEPELMEGYLRDGKRRLETIMDRRD